jgi:hypothetical protein
LLNNAQNLIVGVATGWSGVPKGEVLDELDRVLQSPQFRSSKKCSRFLRHVVEAALDGRFECLKERTIGVDVFEREPHYDTNQDPIVRGTAGEVRKRLAQYYVESGHEGEPRISLPAGSYVPEIHFVAATQTPSVPAEVVALQAVAPSRKRNWHPSLLRLGGVVAAVLIAALVYSYFRSNPLDRFWAPLFRSTNTVLVCLGQPQVYVFRSKTLHSLNTWFENDPTTNSSERDHPPAEIASVPLSDIQPLWGTTITLPDAQAYSRLAKWFARDGRQTELRGERSVSLADLRGKPCIFIGAFNNDWTRSLAGDWRFYFDENKQTHAQIIRDRLNPQQPNWQLVDPWPPGKDIANDYALVTRVVDRTTEQTIVILGGITQYGTEAAAEFVTNPSYFAAALAHAPSNWSGKNIQVVLSTRVISGNSGPPRVQAVHFW